MSDKKAQVVLEFESAEAKDRFIGGLLDGWGEGGPFSVDWDSGKRLRDGRCEIHAGIADVLRITVLEDE